MTPSNETGRLSVGRLIAAFLAIAAVAYLGVRVVQATAASAQVPGPTTFAGYVDVTATPTYRFEAPTSASGRNVILSFVVADRQAPCLPTWGTYYTLDQAASVLDIDRRIAQLRESGGDVRVSFGGLLNDELSTVCLTPAALRDAYAAVVDRYDLSSIDLDVEGDAALGADSGARRAAAIKALQDRQSAKGRPLAVWLTLPVSTGGLTDQAFNSVSQMLSAGVELAGVNGMAMNFGGSREASMSMAAAVEQAATELHRQLGTAYDRAERSLNATALWGKVGLTLMAGQNDVPADRVSIDDATDVNNFARTQGVSLLSLWSLNRDARCPAPYIVTSVKDSCSGVDQGTKSFADVLATGTQDGSFTASPADPAATSVPSAEPSDDPATSPYPIWDSAGEYPAGTKTVWKRQVYQAKWWTKGFAPDTNVVQSYDSPWRLVGPVLPGDRPAPLPTLPAGTYPQWDPATVYTEGQRVQLDLVPYQAKWWTKGDSPDEGTSAGLKPWTLVQPGQ